MKHTAQQLDALRTVTVRRKSREEIEREQLNAQLSSNLSLAMAAGSDLRLVGQPAPLDGFAAWRKQVGR